MTDLTSVAGAGRVQPWGDACPWGQRGRTPAIAKTTHLHSFELWEYPDWWDKGSRSCGARRWRLVLRYPSHRGAAYAKVRTEDHASRATATARILDEFEVALLAAEAPRAQAAAGI